MLATLIVVLVAAIGGWFVLKAQMEAEVARERQIREAQDRLRTVALFMIVRATERGWSFAPYDGKRFVLASLAWGDIDRRRPENLKVFWSPEPDVSMASAGGALQARYAQVTKDALEQGLDVSGLTTHAGRLNRTEGCRITAEQEREGTPILADAQIDGVVLVAFSTGAVKRYGYAELGLPDGGPVVFGPDSPAALLRCLSDK